MKVNRLRIIVSVAVCALIIFGIVLNTGHGTISGFGIADIAVLCPLGALETMLASRTFIPVAIVSLVVAAALCLLFGKAFCAWICPSGIIRELRGKKQAKGSAPLEGAATDADAAEPAGAEVAAAVANEPVAPIAGTVSDTADTAGTIASTTAGTVATAGAAGSANAAAASDPQKRRLRLDSRHAVLLAALASATIFGFPVFCLICPIGLLFGTVVLLCQFFGGIGEVSLSLVVFPVVLVLELVVARKWCTRFCPLGALLSLLSMPNRTFTPKVDAKKCIKARGGTCDKCRESCLEDLDPHCSDRMNECSKCGRCAKTCPVHAISFSVFEPRMAADAGSDTSGSVLTDGK